MNPILTYLASKRRLRILFAIGLLSLNFMGCQSLQPKNSGELALKNHDFIDLWDTYTDCRSGSIPQEMESNLETLHSAPKPMSLDDSPIPVPKFIKKLSSARNSRLAVDPRAMTAACAIHLAETSRQTADWDTSLRTYQFIVENFPEPQYGFYVSEASQAIKEFSSIQTVALPSRDSLVR